MIIDLKCIFTPSPLWILIWMLHINTLFLPQGKIYIKSFPTAEEVSLSRCFPGSTKVECWEVAILTCFPSLNVACCFSRPHITEWRSCWWTELHIEQEGGWREVSSKENEDVAIWWLLLKSAGEWSNAHKGYLKLMHKLPLQLQLMKEVIEWKA